MRLYFLLLWLSTALLEVLALDSAAPWEMLYFYSAYKSEWLAGMTGAQRKIATLCVHKNANAASGTSLRE